MNKDKTIEKRAGFTQGPWTSDWVGTKPSGSAVVWLGKNANKRIEVSWTGRDEANARLIANSPAMYDMLRDVSKVLDGLEAIGANLPYYFKEDISMSDKLRELLAKVDRGDEG